MGTTSNALMLRLQSSAMSQVPAGSSRKRLLLSRQRVTLVSRPRFAAVCLHHRLAIEEQVLKVRPLSMNCTYNTVCLGLLDSYEVCMSRDIRAWWHRRLKGRGVGGDTSGRLQEMCGILCS
jgi:hypothetical protein